MIQTEKKWVGDFLLAFGQPEVPTTARDTSTWVLAKQAAGACFYLTSPGLHWKGAPCTNWKEGDFEYWMLGVVWGERTRFEPQNWPGHFILLGLDAKHNIWHVWTDRCGTFHAYYYVSTYRSAIGSFSPSVGSLTEKQLDFEALSGFFSFGFFPQDRTYLQGLKIIRPATHICFDDNGQIIKQERLWQWKYEPNHHITFSDAVDAFAEIFQQVISEQISGRHVAFPISGGLDSRSTIAALEQPLSEANLWCYSYGYSHDSAETRIAQRIASTRNLPFQKFTIQPYLFDKLSLVMDCVEGFQDITQCRQAFVTDMVASHSDYVMAAHWGDVWLDDMGLVGKPSTMTTSDLVDYAYKKFYKNSHWLLNEVFGSTQPSLNTEDFLRSMLYRELEELGDISDPDFRIKALKTELWSFRWTTASIRMFQPGGFPLLPFYDARLVEFFCTLPTDFLSGRKLQIEYLKRYAPDLARITWQGYDADLYWYRYFNSLLLPRRAIKKLARQISNKPVIQRNWEVQFLSIDGRKQLEQSLIENDLKILTFISLDDIKILLDQFYTYHSKTDAYAISMLLTFSSWLELYA